MSLAADPADSLLVATVVTRLGHSRPMDLYTCGAKTTGPGLMHPCAKAGDALDAAGHSYEVKTVPGYKMLFWTRGGDERSEIEELSGQSDVPILVLDDGEVISGSGTIADWAAENPA